MQTRRLCKVCGGGGFLLDTMLCRDCGTPSGYIAGEDLKAGAVYIGPDGRLYNSPQPKHNED